MADSKPNAPTGSSDAEPYSESSADRKSKIRRTAFIVPKATVTIRPVTGYLLYVDGSLEGHPWEPLPDAQTAAARLFGGSTPLRIERWSASVPVRVWNYDPQISDWVELIR